MAVTRAAQYSLRSLRIGINSGPVVAGVIGRRRLLYDLWEATVNTASRMESHGISGQIQITETTRALLDGKFTCTERGVIDVKGKGPTRTWLLDGEAVGPLELDAVARRDVQRTEEY